MTLRQIVLSKSNDLSNNELEHEKHIEPYARTEVLFEQGWMKTKQENQIKYFEVSSDLQMIVAKWEKKGLLEQGLYLWVVYALFVH